MKNYPKRISLILISLGLLSLAGCGPRYSSKSLPKLHSTQAHYEQTKENIEIKARQLNRSETESLFDGRGHYLAKRRNPIIPIRVSIKNTSDQLIMINNNDIGLMTLSPKELQDILQFDAAARTLGIAATGGVGSIGLLLFGAIPFTAIPFMFL